MRAQDLSMEHKTAVLATILFACLSCAPRRTAVESREPPAADPVGGGGGEDGHVPMPVWVDADGVAVSGGTQPMIADGQGHPWAVDPETGHPAATVVPSVYFQDADCGGERFIAPYVYVVFSVEGEYFYRSRGSAARSASIQSARTAGQCALSGFRAAMISVDDLISIDSPPGVVFSPPVRLEIR